MATRDPPATPSLVAMSSLTGGKSLNDSIPGKHSTIDGEVSAHHECTHGSVFLRQLIRFVRKVGAVLSSIDEHQTGEARAASVDLVHGITPAAAMAEPCVQH